MEAKEIILRSLRQSQGFLDRALDGLTEEEAAWSPGVECNSIAFILWHTARVEDLYINRVIRLQDDIYVVEGWQEKLGIPAREMGYRYTVEQLQAWPVPKLEILRGYANSVREKTLDVVQSVTPETLSEVPNPDRPAETVGAILGRVATEVALHVGQIAYLRGMQRGMDK